METGTARKLTNFILSANSGIQPVSCDCDLMAFYARRVYAFPPTLRHLHLHRVNRGGTGLEIGLMGS